MSHVKIQTLFVNVHLLAEHTRTDDVSSYKLSVLQT